MGQMAAVLHARAGHQPGDRQRDDRRNLRPASRVGLIGRTVTWTDADKTTPHRRRREGHDQPTASPSLTVGGTDGVDPSSITQVA